MQQSWDKLLLPTVFLQSEHLGIRSSDVQTNSCPFYRDSGCEPRCARGPGVKQQHTDCVCSGSTSWTWARVPIWLVTSVFVLGGGLLWTFQWVRYLETTVDGEETSLRNAIRDVCCCSSVPVVLFAMHALFTLAHACRCYVRWCLLGTTAQSSQREFMVQELAVEIDAMELSPEDEAAWLERVNAGGGGGHHHGPSHDDPTTLQPLWHAYASGSTLYTYIATVLPLLAMGLAALALQSMKSVAATAPTGATFCALASLTCRQNVLRLYAPHRPMRLHVTVAVLSCAGFCAMSTVS